MNHRSRSVEDMIRKHRLNMQYALDNAMAPNLIIWENFQIDSSNVGDVVQIFGMNNNRQRYRILSKIRRVPIPWPAQNGARRNKWGDNTFLLQRL